MEEKLKFLQNENTCGVKIVFLINCPKKEIVILKNKGEKIQKKKN